MPNTFNLSASDVDALSRIVNAEAGNQSERGQRAVFYSVLNRANAASGGFPKTVPGVIEQRNQFEPMQGRSSWRDLPEAPQHRERVLGWIDNFDQSADPTGGGTFFQNTEITNRRGTNFAGGARPTAVIEDHSFYDRYGSGPQVAINPYQVAYGGSPTRTASIPTPTPRPNYATAYASQGRLTDAAQAVKDMLDRGSKSFNAFMGTPAMKQQATLGLVPNVRPGGVPSNRVPIPTARPSYSPGYIPVPTSRPEIGGAPSLSRTGHIPIPTARPTYSIPDISTVPIPTPAPRIGGYGGIAPGNIPIPTPAPRSSSGGPKINIPIPTPRPKIGGSL